jgi:hypothetical protein
MPRAKREAGGLILARFMMQIMKVNASILLGSDTSASEAGDILICVAIWMAQVENRPMTANKLAAYIGMPRPTVIRRLRELKARNLVIDVDTKWRLNLEADDNDQKVAAIIDANLQHMRDACQKLSKVDSRPVAARDSR